MTAPLGFVVCGAPLAARAIDVARALTDEGWTLSIGVSEAGAEWVDPDKLAVIGEHAVATRRRHATERRRTPRPEQVVAFPLTFNTANKIAAGIMDNHVTGTLCDALGTGASVLATLMVNDRLWGHPTWDGTLDWLTAAGVRFLDPRVGDVTRPEPLPSGIGEQVVDGFDPRWIVDAVAALPGDDS
ncbi:flavoprotein [Pseudonocardia nantongensis]|uniref:flavoprotein n=1 Tax=Pseudonocardia nantongensis TaxID=1181885 RepID=UPI0039780969